MKLRLVASGDGDALVLRNHLVPRIREEGAIEVQRDAVRLIVWQDGDLRCEHWTPFNDLLAGEASSPGYRRALTRQHSEPDLPYGLDVWASGTQVLSVLWADDGSYKVVSFTRGDWEREALRL